MALLVFVNPELFHDQLDALTRLFTLSISDENPITRNRIEKAKKMMNPFILRRKKSQVLHVAVTGSC